jgi:hypothetical protein
LRLELLTEEDALKILAPLFDQDDDDDDGIDDVGLAWDELDVEDGGMGLLEHAMEDDPNDTDWIPPEMRKRVQRRSEGACACTCIAILAHHMLGARPSTYATGPDIMRKAPRTQRRYRAALANQSSLDSYLTSLPAPCAPSRLASTSHLLPISEVIDLTLSDSDDVDTDIPNQSGQVLPSHSSSVAPELRPPLSFLPQEKTRARSSTVLSDPSTDAGLSDQEDEEDDPLDWLSDEELEDDDADVPQTAIRDLEEWEGELDECVEDAPSMSRSIQELRDEIDKRYKTRFKTLSRSEANQLIILRNFFTLQMKGYTRTDASKHIAEQWRDGVGTHFARRVCALARHYQLVGKLLSENRGGARSGTSYRGTSLLMDEHVEARCRSWLTAQKIGTVTPFRFARGLENEIFPDLGITTIKPLVVRTAQRWLIRLGWRRSLVKKGVYKDGHDRDDVIKYRDHDFLPRMKLLEARMVTYEGPEQVKTVPVLKEGEKRVVPCFHDECCMHANDAVSSAWIEKDRQPLRSKNRGRLIHVSDFVTEETGRLIIRDEDGSILEDARKIIFPGSNGDPWWDCAQLIEQMKSAIKIFNKAYPDCQALFIFDQSSAHASLPPDALRAFEMNRSDGGKQRIQRDTIIPDSNPDENMRGKPQKMTLPDGTAKGLERVLSERGFNISQIKRAKCKPICPFESSNCCMARVLSQQEDFVNQTSMLEQVITEAGHLCMFLPKFHCELNPIEMVSLFCN